MDKIMILFFGAVLLFMIIIPLYLHTKHGKHRIFALTVKGVATLIPILFCLSAILSPIKVTYVGFNSIHILPTISYWLLAGLILCLFGDIILEIHFISGMGAFLLGHICYITAFCIIAPINFGSIVIFILLILLILKLFYPSIPNMGDNKIAFLIYGSVILIMVSIALLLPFSVGIWGIVPAVGAFLFVLSDFLLARNLFIKSTPFSDAVSLYCYYAGLLTLSASVYLFFLFV
jgi:uncharacterized membrane protein YhhN